MNAEHGEENVQVKPHAYVHSITKQRCSSVAATSRQHCYKQVCL